VKIRFVVLSMILTFSMALASDSAAQTTLEFHAFRAVTKDGTRLDGREGVLTSNELRATAGDGTMLHIPREDLDLLDLQNGSRVTKYAVAGAVAGGLVSVGAILSVEANPDYELRTDRVLPFTAGLIAVGALVGAIVGSNQKVWKNVELSAGSSRRSPSNSTLSLMLRF
jgi:hypothetical protein